jgi:HK97 gp10 family phage protein
MNINIEIKNIAQIKSAFHRAPYLMTKNLSGAIRRVALKVQSESMKITPVQTGFLRRSHTTAFETPLRASVQPTANYAAFVHDGTKFMPARPFLANAVEITQGFTDTEFEKAVQDTLDSIGKSV